MHRFARGARLAPSLLFLLTPSVAWADEGHGAPESDSSIVTVVALIGVVALAFLLARFVVGRLQKTFLVMAGVESMLLGVLLGPEIPYLSISAFSNLQGLLPIVALAVGWVGLLRGMELRVSSIRTETPTGTAQLALVQALVAGGATTAVAYLAFSTPGVFHFGDLAESREAWIAAGVLGCTAAAGSAEPIALIAKRYRLEGDVATRLRRMSSLSELVAIAAFGILFAIFHPSAPDALVELSATEWAVVAVFVGVTLGVLFRPFLGDDDSENGRFLAMVGIIVLASGAAYFLDLSPLFVNLCLGVVLVNTAKAGPQIHATLVNTRRPMALVLLVFAGALMRPVDPVDGLLVCLAFLALRLGGKAVGTALASWRTPLRGDYFRGLLAHGDVSVAMAVSLRLVYDGPAVDLAYLAILVSVVVNDLIAPRVLRSLLVDTGDLRGERQEATT